jgi:hypothetical protein
MKKKSLRLRLSRETLHSLSSLKEAVGGTTSSTLSCNCSPYPSYEQCTAPGYCADTMDGHPCW